LEHIDRKCGLKVRATGMEGYDTTPRAAMEDAEINEKTLLSRAGEIGAKILQFLRQLYDKATNVWHKFNNNLSTLQNNIEATLQKVKDLDESRRADGPITLKASPELFIGTDFIGLEMTREEWDGLALLQSTQTKAFKELVKPALALIKSQGISEDTEQAIIQMSDDYTSNNQKELPLPGNWTLTQAGAAVDYSYGTGANHSDTVEVDIPTKGELTKLLGDLNKYVTALSDESVMNTLKQLEREVTTTLSGARKGEYDEITFQKLQNAVISDLVKPLSLDKYFTVIRHLAGTAGKKVVLVDQLTKNFYGGRKAE
jgi:hypothetical protein